MWVQLGCNDTYYAVRYTHVVSLSIGKRGVQDGALFIYIGPTLHQRNRGEKSEKGSQEGNKLGPNFDFELDDERWLSQQYIL